MEGESLTLRIQTDNEQKMTENERLLFSTRETNFTAKFELVFVLTQKNASSQTLNFKVNIKNLDPSKNGTRDFQNSPPFDRPVHF